MIPIAIVLIVAVSMGIGAALLGYPAWAIPLIAIFGAGGYFLVRLLRAGPVAKVVAEHGPSGTAARPLSAATD